MSLALLDVAPAWCLPGTGLDFDFLNNRYWQQGYGNSVSSLITTSRASTGYSDDTSGNWIVFNTNSPRITNKGIIIEEARTNSIRTTNAAVTRAADVVTVAKVPVGLCNPACTLFGKGTIPANTGNFSLLLAASDGSTNNRAQIYRDSDNSTVRAITTNAGVNGSTTNAGAWSSGVSGKMGYAVASGDQTESFNGSAVSATSNTWPPAATLNQLSIGSIAGSQQFNGYVERIAIWSSTRLSNATLQTVTS